MDLWFPGGIRDALPDCGAFTGGPFKGVLHTTEGGSYSGARAAFVANGSAPHFTVAVENGRFVVRQHIPLDRGAKALMHPSGTVETNRDGAIQIEIVGFSAQQSTWSDVMLAGLASLMRWIEAQTGIKPTSPVFRAYPGSAGIGNGVRMSSAAWDSFNGWCGHQHVPNNDHGDPGAVPIQRLLPSAPVNQPVTFGPAHTFPGDNMVRTPIHIPALDDQGNGWIDTGIPFEKFVTCNVGGPSPDRDGYGWANIYWSPNDTNGNTRLEFEGGTSRQPLDIVVWSVS
jgi:hypothetical protein